VSDGRDLYDSTNAGDIPASAGAVAGYVNGIYAWSAADWARFPSAAKLGIAISADFNGGVVLDIETGDATPAQGPGWVRMRQTAGVGRPCLYCNLSTMPAVIWYCSNAGLVLGTDYSLWIAHYTGVPHGIDGASAVQWADPGMGAGGHYDVSNITNPGWLASLGQTSSGGTDAMSPEERNDVSRALVRLAYVAGGLREPESQDAIAGWVGTMNTEGMENGVAKILDSQEFSDDETAVREMREDYRAGKFASASDFRRALVWLAYGVGGTRWPDSWGLHDNVNHWEAQMEKDGVENGVFEIYHTPEFEADMATVRQTREDYKDGKLGPGAAAPPATPAPPAASPTHTHDLPAGTTGPAKE